MLEKAARQIDPKGPTYIYIYIHAPIYAAYVHIYIYACIWMWRCDVWIVYCEFFKFVRLEAKLFDPRVLAKLPGFAANSVEEVWHPKLLQRTGLMGR